LLLHGSGDSPQTLRYLAERLHAHGYTVHAPLLPGHGRSPSEFARVSADAYAAAARAALDTLRRRHGWIGVGGLSMGGALAAQLAAEAADVKVLVLLAPYLSATPQVAWATRTAPLWGLVQPYVDARGALSVHDPAARAASFAYGVVAPNALRALLETAARGRAALAQVTAATLVIHSRADNRIPDAVAAATTATLRAPTERHWVTGCGHVITVDYCKDAVAALVLAFLARHAG
jgi:carboxylesterase